MSACVHKYRYFVVFLGFFYIFSLQIATTNLIFAIKSMVNNTYSSGHRQLSSWASSPAATPTTTTKLPPTDSSDTCAQSGESGDGGYALKDGPFKWDDNMQTLLLACPSFGQITGTMGALFIYNYCYLRPIISIALIWVGLLNILSPELAYLGGYRGLAIVRFSLGVYEGILVPAPTLITKKWFLPEERDPAMTIMQLGYFTGAMMFSMVGVLNEHLGWQSIFRLPGGVALLCGLMFLVFFSDEPSENYCIGRKERKMLRKPWDPTSRERASASPASSSTTNTKGTKAEEQGTGMLRAVINMHVARHEQQEGAPLLKALTYAPVWAVICGFFGFSWSYEASTTYTQYYLLEMHHFSLGLTSFLNSVPTNLGVILSAVVLSLLFNSCINREWIRKVVVRRIGGVMIATSGLFFIGLGYLPCQAVEKYILPLLLLNSFRSGFFLSVVPSLGDITPTYQEALMTACTIAQFVPGFMVPMLMAQVGKQTRQQWQQIFLISCAIIASSVGFYLLAATDEIQDFDEAAQGTTARSLMPDSSSSASSPSREVSTHLYDQQGMCAQAIKKKWIVQGRNNSKSVWDMAHEDVIEKILEKAEDEIKREQKKTGVPFKSEQKGTKSTAAHSSS